jgi:SPP1 family predicted phage head-tail adaptor
MSKAGKRRFKVILQRRTDAQQTSGQVKHTYEDVTELWASIKPVSGREFFAAQQVQSEVTTTIGIGFRDGIDSTYRIKHITRYSESPQWFDVYDVVSALPDEKTGRRDLLLYSVKREAEGWRG